MKDSKKVSDIKLAKILLKKDKAKKEKKTEKKRQSIDDILLGLPPKYIKKFKEEFNDDTPSRRDIDHFLRKYNLIKKP
jgi:hypothetical protein